MMDIRVNIATVQTGAHSTAQGELVTPEQTTAQNMARIIADFDANVLGRLTHGQARWAGEQLGELMAEYQTELEAE